MSCTEAVMPPPCRVEQLSNKALLDHFEMACGWAEEAFSVRQGKAWRNRAEQCRKEILKRMRGR